MLARCGVIKSPYRYTLSCPEISATMAEREKITCSLQRAVDCYKRLGLDIRRDGGAHIICLWLCKSCFVCLVGITRLTRIHSIFLRVSNFRRTKYQTRSTRKCQWSFFYAYFNLCRTTIVRSFSSPFEQSWLTFCALRFGLVTQSSRSLGFVIKPYIIFFTDVQTIYRLHISVITGRIRHWRPCILMSTSSPSHMPSPLTRVLSIHSHIHSASSIHHPLIHALRIHSHTHTLSIHWHTLSASTHTCAQHPLTHALAIHSHVRSASTHTYTRHPAFTIHSHMYSASTPPHPHTTLTSPYIAHLTSLISPYGPKIGFFWYVFTV